MISGLTPADYGMVKRFELGIPFQLISKSNSKAKGYLEEKYKHYEESIAWIAASVCRRPMFEMGWVVIRPHFKNKAHIDLVNISKSLVDGLVKGMVFKDDKIIACTVVPLVYGDSKSIVEIWADPE